MNNQVHPTDEILIKDEKGEFRVLSLEPKTKDEGLGLGQKDFRSQIKPVAQFYFSPEDEEEVSKFKKQIILNQVQDNKQQIVEELINQRAREIINRVEIAESLKQRLERVIISRLKEARTLVETKIVLQRSSKLGGLGLGEEQMMEVLREVEKERGKIEELITNDKLLITKKSEEKPLVTEIQKEVKTQRGFRDFVIKRKPPEPPLKSIPAIDIRPPIHKPQYLETGSIPQVKRPPLIFSDKKKLTDIKTSPRIIGPIEELKELTIEDFRKLGPSPEEAVKRIQEKIDLLEDESLLKKAEGIKAWKESEPYRIYVGLGKESMEQGKPVEEVAGRERAEGKPTLTCEEFEVIADLNKSLNF